MVPFSNLSLILRRKIQQEIDKQVLEKVGEGGSEWLIIVSLGEFAIQVRAGKAYSDLSVGKRQGCRSPWEIYIAK